MSEPNHTVYLLVIAPCDQSVIGPFSSPTAAIKWSADHGIEPGQDIIMSPQQVLENFHEYGGLPIYHPGEYRHD